MRQPVRRAFGARVAYGLWLLVPLAGAASLPARPPGGAADRAGAAAAPGPGGGRQPRYGPGRRADRRGPGPGHRGLGRRRGPGPWPAGLAPARQPDPARRPTSRGRRADPRRQHRRRPGRGRGRAAKDHPARRLRAALRRPRAEPSSWRTSAPTWPPATCASTPPPALVRCILWFNPLIHLAAHLIRIDQEIACDETVVARHPGDRRAYAQALLKAQVKPAPLPLGCYWPARSRNRLKERLIMLTRKSPTRGRRVSGAAVVGLAALGAGYAAWAAQPAPALISRRRGADRRPAHPRHPVGPGRRARRGRAEDRQARHHQARRRCGCDLRGRRDPRRRPGPDRRGRRPAALTSLG